MADRSVRVRLDAITASYDRKLAASAVKTQAFAREIDQADRGVGRFARDSDLAGSSIDRLSGRVRILADVAAILGPALVPIGAVGVPAITGLAAQLGVATLAVGTTVLAFQGMGDALDALNKAELEPTQENLQAAQIAMERLSPAARDFAQEIRDLVPQARQLRDAASEGFFPGALEGLESLETALPRIASLISAVSTEAGAIAADTGASLASDRWAPFLEFLEQEAPDALQDLSAIVGNSAHALAGFWMAFDPLNDDFSAFLVNATADLDNFASHLDETQGFQDFVAYVDENGPKVADALGAIANAGVQIVQATAPLGGPVLEGLEAVGDVVSAIADSDLGTPIFAGLAALALLNRTLALTGAAQKATFGGPAIALIKGQSTAVRNLTADWQAYTAVTRTAQGRAQATASQMAAADAAAGRLGGRIQTIGRGAAGLTGLTLATSGVADSFGLANTASLALLGTMVAPGWGTAVGAVAGLFIDAAHATSDFSQAIDRADIAIRTSDLRKLGSSLDELNTRRNALKDALDIPAPPRGQSRAFLDLQILEKKADEVQDKLNLELALRVDSTGFALTEAGIDSATQSMKELKEELQEVQDLLKGRADARAFEQDLIDFEKRAKKRAELQRELAEAQAKLGGKGATPSEQNRINRLQEKAAHGDSAAERRHAREDLAALQETIGGRNAESRKQAIEDVKRLREELALYANTLDISTEAGNRNQAALDEFGAHLLQASTTLPEIIKNPDLREPFLDAAREEYIKKAMDFGLTAAQAAAEATEKGLGDYVVGHPVKLVIDATGAIHIIDRVAERLKRLQRLADIKINATLSENKRAAGGRDGDPATPWWSGGFTGWGGKYEPKGIVHGREVVLPDWVVQQDKAHIVSRYGFLPGMDQLRGYADGGFVHPVAPPAAARTTIVAGPEIDYDRLTQAMAQMQPMIGQQIVQPHDYDQFRREQEQVRRMASVGGRPSGGRE